MRIDTGSWTSSYWLMLTMLASGCVVPPASPTDDAGPGIGTGGGTDAISEGSGSDSGDDQDPGSGGDSDDSGSGSDTGTQPPGECVDPAAGLVPLFEPEAEEDVAPIVTVRDDGVIVTRGAGRVRGRHELEAEYSPYGSLYFVDRSYRFTIEDYVATGEDRIDITYEPEAPVSTFGSQTNLRAWKIYGNGNVFYNNTSLETVDLQHQTKSISGNYRENRPMQVGDQMEFEFGIFLAGNSPEDPGAVEGRTAYYTDTYRYQVGQGGLSPNNLDSSSVAGPSPEDSLAGATTIPYIVMEPEFSFSQMALNMQPEHVQSFLEGRRLFHTDFASGAHSEVGNPDLMEVAGTLGPMFNTASCVACHERNGRSVPPPEGGILTTTAVKLYDDPVRGDQLQPQEAEVTLDRYETHRVTLSDGVEVELRRPVYGGVEPDWAYSPRVARQLTGLGLLEAIDPAQILAEAVGEGCTGGQVSGRAMTVIDPVDGALRLGRLGWKAEKISVRHQVADALVQDMGVTTAVFPADDGSQELADEDLERLTNYIRLLGVPGRRNTDDPQVQRGEGIFADIGCNACHRTEAFTTGTHPFVELRDQTIRPFSDLLLHDMGEGLSDPAGGPLASEWRTAPLWGIGLVQTVGGELSLLHDGRARSVLEAVLWHDAEAEFASEAVRQLSSEDRAALLAFIDSL